MKAIYETSGYVADPHGAVGYLGAKKYLENHDDLCVFLETAHPVKFLDTVVDTLGVEVAIPLQIEAVLDKEKKSTLIDTYNDLKAFLVARDL